MVRPTLDYEVRVGFPRLIVAGVDEVGRGCLAGPVVAGALILPSDLEIGAADWISDIADSKLLSHEQRERLDPLIRDWARAVAIGVASVEEIDRINIHAASHLAMKRALDGLGLKLDHILVDGKFVPKNMGGPTTAIIKGDQKSLSIAAASIVAKVWRDRLMANLDGQYPGYEFARHKGYSTAIHKAALKKLGITDQHRRSFAPVRELL